MQGRPFAEEIMRPLARCFGGIDTSTNLYNRTYETVLVLGPENERTARMLVAAIEKELRDVRGKQGE